MAANTPPCIVCGNGAALYGSRTGYDFFRCMVCAHLFVWPTPPGIHDIYSEDYFTGARGGFGYTDYDRDKLAMVPTFNEYLLRMERALGRTGSLLDIGAATGFFLDLARHRNWKVRGVEVSKPAAAIARSKGLDVWTGVVEDCEYPAQDLDAVSMWDVLEHMADPHSTMKHVSQLLKPGSVLAINTPDSSSLIPKLLKLKWHLLLPPEHLNLFSRQSLRYLLEQHQFEILELTTIGKTFTVQYTFHFLLKTFGLVNGPAGSMSRALNGTRVGSWGVPINLWDNVFALARKL